ncbi:aminotransferase class V-fold PLP-dependent enzyme [Haladaptatus sp. NG-SE-30]
MNEQSIYQELGVNQVINATGTKTRIGGSLIRKEALEAMEAAAESFVRLSDLQARASELIADVTGAEAGYVTSGAEAGMLLGAAAAIAGDNLGIMERLPQTNGIPNEIIMPRTHRTGYDHAFRAAGATIVDVGTNDFHLGTGSSNVELWEMADAINEKTVAIGYVQKPYTQPPLEEVVEMAHDHDVPVIVDAAAELPPVKNLERFVDIGADLVAFSGGKAIRGPQTTGILAGRRDLIESVALQQLDMHAAKEVWSPPESLVDINKYDGVPRQGIGRANKVGKEELVGLMTALELFLEEDHEQLQDTWHKTANRIANELSNIKGLKTTVTSGGDESVAPEVIVKITPTDESPSAITIVQRLRKENPRVYVGADRMQANEFVINPMCLNQDEVQYVIDRIHTNVTEPSPGS